MQRPWSADRKPANPPKYCFIIHIFALYWYNSSQKFSAVFPILCNFVLLFFGRSRRGEYKKKKNSGGCFRTTLHSWIDVYAAGLMWPWARVLLQAWELELLPGLSRRIEVHPQQGEALPGRHDTVADALVRNWGHNSPHTFFFPISYPNCWEVGRM